MGEVLRSLVVQVDPMGKPRMTQRDKWKKRPAVERYWAFKDAVRKAMGDRVVDPSLHMEVWFHMPMPRSWSAKKKKAMAHRPHQQKPDMDNCLKALLDALLDDDAAAWSARIMKSWSPGAGRIEITWTEEKR